MLSYLCSPAVHVEAGQLAIARQARVLAVVGWGGWTVVVVVASIMVGSVHVGGLVVIFRGNAALLVIRFVGVRGGEDGELGDVAEELGVRFRWWWRWWLESRDHF